MTDNLCGMCFVVHLAEFRKAVDAHMNNSVSVLQQGLMDVYDNSSQTLQEKLQELFATLDRIGTWKT